MIRRKRRILSPWQCESDEDYYDQFKNIDRDDSEDYGDEEDWEPQDDDCDYWKRVMRG